MRKICIGKGHQTISSVLSLYSSMATEASSKTVVRADIIKKLKLLTPEEKQRQSKDVLCKLLELPSFQKSKRVSTYLSTDIEIDTEPIVRKIFEADKTCFIPRYSKTAMEMVKLNSMDDWANLPVTSWGIKQPSLKEPREKSANTGGLDFIIVPGVGFTSSGARLGHGGGYYDKYLKNIKESQAETPVVVALAFKQQIVADLPTTDYDIKVELVLYAD